MKRKNYKMEEERLMEELTWNQILWVEKTEPYKLWSRKTRSGGVGESTGKVKQKP
jgi:tRNA A22 N-methylase